MTGRPLQLDPGPVKLSPPSGKKYPGPDRKRSQKMEAAAVAFTLGLALILWLLVQSLF